ncbi:MAG TPA: DUF4350 domain-containing protein [Candidatus Angelobacter sp.]
MQIKLDKSDRRLLMWAGLILLPIIVVLALLSDQEEDSGVPSTYSARSTGAQAAYLFLKEEGYNVEQWTSPPEELPRDPHDTVLVLASPQGTPTRQQKTDLLLYLSRGGRILATGYNVSSFLPGFDLVPEPIPSAVWREYQPEILSPITRAGVIRMSPGSHWGDPKSGQVVHYAHAGKGIVVSYKVGAGEVIWWAANTPLTNTGINQAGNLDLLLNSLGSSRENHILWDEYFHSSLSTPTYSLWVPATAWGLAQCGLAFLALLLTFSRRNAPIRPLNQPSRLSPLEFVQTLGKLYRRANATRTALEVPFNTFRMLLIKRLGLRHDASSSELLESARKKLGYRDPDFEDTMNQVLQALQDPNLKEAKVLDLVQKLNQHTRNLKLIPQEE